MKVSQTGDRLPLGVREDITKNKNIEHVYCAVCTLLQILTAVIRN